MPVTVANTYTYTKNKLAVSENYSYNITDNNTGISYANVFTLTYPIFNITVSSTINSVTINYSVIDNTTLTKPYIIYLQNMNKIPSLLVNSTNINVGLKTYTFSDLYVNSYYSISITDSNQNTYVYNNTITNQPLPTYQVQLSNVAYDSYNTSSFTARIYGTVNSNYILYPSNSYTISINNASNNSTIYTNITQNQQLYISNASLYNGTYIVKLNNNDPNFINNFSTTINVTNYIVYIYPPATATVNTKKDTFSVTLQYRIQTFDQYGTSYQIVMLRDNTQFAYSSTLYTTTSNNGNNSNYYTFSNINYSKNRSYIFYIVINTTWYGYTSIYYY